jgi:hypothetical protein
MPAVTTTPDVMRRNAPFRTKQTGSPKTRQPSEVLAVLKISGRLEKIAGRTRA